MNNNEIDVLLSKKTEEVKKVRTVYKEKESQLNKDFESTMNLIKEQLDEKLNELKNQIEYIPNLEIVFTELIHNDFITFSIYYDFETKDNDKKLFFHIDVYNLDSWIPFKLLFSDNSYPTIKYNGNKEYQTSIENFLLAKGYFIKNRELILNQIDNVFIPTVKEKIIRMFTEEIETMNNVIEKTDY